MSQSVVVPIVEGHGDVLAVPVLLRRVFEGSSDGSVAVLRAIRVKRQQIIQPDVLEKYVRVARAAIADHGGRGGVLVVLDADDECAATRGPELLHRIRTSHASVPSECALAVREFESWLVAGHEAGPPVTDEKRPGKRWLADEYGQYAETVDQPKLAADMDLTLAEGRSRSFRHFVECARRLEAAISHM